MKTSQNRRNTRRYSFTNTEDIFSDHGQKPLKEPPVNDEEQSLPSAERKLICYCFEIYEDELIEIIQKYRVQTVSGIQEHCTACTGCRGCRADLEELIHKHFPNLRHKESAPS